MGHPGEAAAGEGRAAHGGSPARHRTREETSPAWGGDTRPQSAHPRGPRHKDGSGHRHGRCSGPDRRFSLQARQWAAGQVLSLPQGPRDGPRARAGVLVSPLGWWWWPGSWAGPRAVRGSLLGSGQAGRSQSHPSASPSCLEQVSAQLTTCSNSRRHQGNPAEDKRVGERGEASGRGGPALTASPHPHGAVLTPRISACGYLTLYRGNQGETRRQGGP